jgi:uncharacterized FlgJ-related protein
MNKQLISFKTSVVIVGGMIAAFIILSVTKPPVVIEKVKTVTVYKDKLVQPKIEELNKENVMKYLKELNVKFPHIVLAQAIIESGTFTSKICKKNNNLFGMREARLRISNNLGTQFGHAVYSNWKESVVDYALYQATYLSKCKTEEQYYSYLADSYAAGPKYSVSVKKIADNLK